MEWRYGVSSKDVEDLEAAIMRTPRLPWVINHPVIDAMRAVDY